MTVNFISLLFYHLYTMQIRFKHKNIWCILIIFLFLGACSDIGGNRLNIATASSSHHAIKEIAHVFQEKYKAADRIGGATTLTGALESDKELILFGMGDSRAFVLTEAGILEGSLTESHAMGSMVTSYLGAGNESGTFQPYYPEEISIKRILKEDLPSTAYLILISDGMIPAKHEEEVQSFSKALKAHLDKPEDLAAAALNFAQESEGGLILPDDKTIVAIQFA